MLCVCMGYSHEEIEEMITNGSYVTFEDFQQDTFVGTGCGRCLSAADEIFRKVNS